MIHFTLKRTLSSDKGTFGELFIVDELICYTLELPDKDNEENESCIPAGDYFITPWFSPHHGWCFKIWNVPEREDILIHRGNTLEDTKGCTLVGMEQTSHDLGLSAVALEKLQDMIGDRLCRLTITQGE